MRTLLIIISFCVVSFSVPGITQARLCRIGAAGAASLSLVASALHSASSIEKAIAPADSFECAAAAGLSDEIQCTSPKRNAGAVLNLSIAKSLNSQWKLPVIIEHLKNTARIYWQYCGVSLNKIQIIEEDFPDTVTNAQTVSFDSAYAENGPALVFTRMLKQKMKRPKAPLLVLIDGKLDSTEHAYAYEEDGTAFFSFLGEDRRIKDRESGNNSIYPQAPFDVFAHEIGHLLIDGGHKRGYDRLGHVEWRGKDEGNLMEANGFLAGEKLTPLQCDRIKANIGKQL
ncbi:MAG: hypothetical protein EOP06_05580 [Proteobacteria bacterium]|nr:MAG: hypothetical protein EOP06_05580 [Pseudomonadota bacterium]